MKYTLPTTTLLAFLGGPVSVFLFYIIISFVLKRDLPDLSEEVFFILLQIVWTSIPFIYLRLKEVRLVAVWSTVFAFTMLFYAAAAWLVAESSKNGTGANIGLGLVFLIFPFLLVGIGALCQHLLEGRPQGNAPK